MWSIILNSHRQELKANVAKTNKFSLIYPPVYFLFFCPLLMLRGDRIQSFILYYSIIIPAVFSILLSMLFHNKVSKTMFLVPTTEADRRKYIIQTSIIRLTLYAALLVIGFIVCSLTCNMAEYPYIVLLNAALGAVELECGEGPDQRANINVPRSISAITVIKIVATFILIVVPTLDRFELAHHPVFIIVCLVNAVLGFIYVIYYYPKIIKANCIYNDKDEKEA